MTDFLDQLEHHLDEAAKRRARRRALSRPVMAVAAAALVVACVVAGFGAIDFAGDRERLAITPPSVDRGARVKILDDYGGSPFSRELARRGYHNVSGLTGREEAAFDSSTPTSVLFRPGAEATADAIARELKLGVRPTPLSADADRRMFGAVPPDHRADVLVIIGADGVAGEAAIALADCRPAGVLQAGRLSVCDAESLSGATVVLERGERHDPLALAVTVPRPSDGKFDRGLSFPWAAAAPDGRDFLVQVRWHCRNACSNAREAYFASARGTEVRSVDGNVHHGWNTIALGWTDDNRAIVLREDDPECRASAIYLIARDGKRTFAGCTAGSRPPASLRPSIEPRSVRTVESAVRR